MEKKQTQSEINFLDIWDIFKRCWWKMALVFVLVSVAVFGYLKTTHVDRYTASLKIYVMQKFDDKGVTNTQQIAIAENLLSDCELLFKSHDHVLSKVIESEGLQLSPSELERMFTVTRIDEDARILRISVTTGNAKRSAEIANAIADAAYAYILDIYKMEMLNIVDYAKVPTGISNPISSAKILLVGIVAALAVYVFYLVRHMLDDKINNREDVERYLGVSILGVIPNKHEAGKRRSKNGYYYSASTSGAGSPKEARKEGVRRETN